MLAKCESDRARLAITKSSVRSDQLRWKYCASFTTRRRPIWYFHVAALSRRSFTGFSKRLVNAREYYGRGTRDGLVLHDARHTATTHLLESNVSPKTVQEWMGWSDKAFVLYYSHATKQSREQAGQSLERLAGRKTA